MEENQLLNNLKVPSGKIDVVLDTDAYNEIDDQFAIAYMLKCSDKLNVKGICAAPFYNSNSQGPCDGMVRSYDEIKKILKLMRREEVSVHKGSKQYLVDESTPVESEAADFMGTLAKEYSPQKPLYIVAIGAITNVASAIIKYPEMKENTVIVWLGGHGVHMPITDEFNMKQDIAAARVIFNSGVPFVQLPCAGVVSQFYISKPELEYWLMGKNELCTYLAENTIKAAEKYASGKPWTRVIWDVTAVAWLVNDNRRFMYDKVIPAPVPEYNNTYSFDDTRHKMTYVYYIHRDALMRDLIERLVD
ncbi:MAG: nucleoside hydrolase [Clostridia bacterium]|nr:nucleoside hydrolase [Clostridia bacterium]